MDEPQDSPSVFWTKWSALICARPRLIVLLGGLLAVVALALSAASLEFQPNRNDLLSAKLDWNQRFMQWRERFPGARDLYVVIDAGADGEHRAAAEQFAANLARELQSEESIERLEWGGPAGAFSPKAARLLPIEEFEALLEQFAEADPLLASERLGGFLSLVASQLVQQQTGGGDSNAAAGAIASLTGLIDAVADEIETGESGSVATWMNEQAGPMADLEGQWRALSSPNGRFVLVRVTPRAHAGTLNAFGSTIDAVRWAMDVVRAELPNVEAGLTGIEAIEADETKAAMRDSAIASMVALVLIALILITAFHSVRTPVLIVVSLLVGVAWSFGYLTLAVGHLQILSVVFVVILLGLGVDFGIHLASTFETIRHKHPEESFCEALGEALGKIAPGVITGAVTTAVAFFITALTDFKGVAEMGLIAGGGVLLCLIAMLTVFPALKVLFSSSHEHIRPLDDRSLHVYKERWSMPFARHPRVTTLVAMTIMVLAGASAWQIRFDYNLPALLPSGMASVQWQERLERDGGVSIWSATSIVGSMEEARARQTAFEALPTVARVEGIALLTPRDEVQKLTLVRDATAPLSDQARIALGLEESVSDAPAVSPDFQAQIGLLGVGVTQALRRTDLPEAVRAALEGASGALGRVESAAGELNEDEARARIKRIDDSYRSARAALVGMAREMIDPAALKPTDLPAAFLRGSIAHDGDGFALKIHPRLPEDGSIASPLDPRFLPRFIEDVERVDPNVTGVVVQFQKSGDLIRGSFMWAGGVALAAVFVIVLIVFRSLLDAALALAPVLFAFVVTLGAMRLIGQNVTPANIVVLPLLFGIGVDAGVHIVHRYRENPTARPLGLTAGTGKGITVTSLTTIAGFGAMMMARHRGIASLGMVLTLGISVTMFASWTVLPAMLELREKVRRRT